jgi:hypothetical protein
VLRSDLQAELGSDIVGALAAIRPDSWNLPLLLHVLGAMILVGGTLTAVAALAIAHGRVELVRLGYRSLLLVALPGWALMFAGAEWSYREEGLAEGAIDSAWVLIGFLVAEVGFVLLLLSVVLGGIGARRARGGRGSTLLLGATLGISVVLLAAYAVAVWAMTAKPQ